MESPTSSSGEFEGRGELQQLMLKTEAVVDDVLKPQVERFQKHQEKVFQELFDVQTLADHIELLKLQQQERLREHNRQMQQLRELHVLRAASADNGSQASSRESSEKWKLPEDADAIPLEALVNVGSHLYVKAVGDDIGRILVNVGFQFFLEMTLDEAAQFLRRKELLLTKKYEYWSLKCSGVKAQIQMLLQSISALIEEPSLQMLPF